MRIVVMGLLLSCLAECVEAATWYVRPDTDGHGTDLNYGAEDGTSTATAFDGFAAITGLNPGDTICLPGSEEPFFGGDRLNTDTAGTAAQPIIYKSCGTTDALIWNAQDLSGTRSFDSNRAAISNATYAWVSDGGGLYHKRIDVRAEQLWEDATWLQPVNIDQGGETGLTAGQWGMKDTGGGTYALYYRASTPTGSPTAQVIRCNDVTTSDNPFVNADVRIDQNYITLQHVEVRGHTGRGIGILDASGTVLDTVTLNHTKIGYWVSGDAVKISQVRLIDVTMVSPHWTGAYIQGGVAGVGSILIQGGHYDDALGTHYNGTGFTAGDGDGIGIGQAGGAIDSITIRNVTANRNTNAGIFIGTSESMSIAQVTVQGVSMIGNGANCFAEGSTTARVDGPLTITGFLCQDIGNNTTSSGMRFAVPAAARTVTLTNGVFAGNASAARISFRPHANNRYRMTNLVFTSNPGATSGNVGDLYSFATDLIGTEVFSNLYFYSTPNAAKRLGTLGSGQTAYLYNSGTDRTNFVTALQGSNITINTDPGFLSSTDFRPALTSPLRNAGAAVGACRDVRDRACPSTAPHLGAYQSTSGDPAATRAVRN